jgi:hypothetical protein
MKRVEFRLSMPSRGSWNGGWSGAEKNYTITLKLRAETVDKLLAIGQWYHRWDDGWTAGIAAREVPKGERLRKSDGFSGYDWMVYNILDHGDTSDKAKDGQ